MSAIDRRTFLRGILFGWLGAVLGWEVEAVAEAAPPEEEIDEITLANYPGNGWPSIEWEPGEIYPTIIYLRSEESNSGLVSRDGGITFVQCDYEELASPDMEWHPAEVYVISQGDKE